MVAVFLKQTQFCAGLASMERELWLTPEVVSFLRTNSASQAARELNDDIVRAVKGEIQFKNGRTRITVPPFLSQVLPPLSDGSPERVIYWHGPTDGIFIQDSIVGRASLAGFAFA